MTRSAYVYRVVLALFSILLESPVIGQLAQPGTIYASSSDGKIYELNEDYSQKALVVQTDLEEIRSIAINSSGEVYAVDRDSLYSINLLTGESTAISAAPTPSSQFSAISFGQSDQLYITESIVNSSFWHRLQLYNFESGEFELPKWLSDNEDVFMPSLAIDPYTNTPYYLYRVPFFDNILLGQVQDPPLTPKTTQLDGVSWGVLHFDLQGRLTVVERDRINYVDRFSGKIYTRKSREQFVYTDIASILPPLESLPPVIVEAGELLDFDEIATGGSGEQQISVANMSNDEVVISFNKTDDNGSVLELPQSGVLGRGQRRICNFKLHVTTAGTVGGDLELRYGTEEGDVASIRYQAVGFDVHPIDTDALYATSRNPSTNEYYLNKVDVENKKTTRVSTLSKPVGMISANSEGVLYGIANDDLYLIDAESGKAQKLASIGFMPRSIAFDPDDRLYIPYIDLEDGSIPYVYLARYNITSGDMLTAPYVIISKVGYPQGTGQIAVSHNGQVALLGDKGLAYGRESLYSTESTFPEEQLILGLSDLKDIVFYKDGSLLGYGSSLGKIDIESGAFNPVGATILGFVGFVKHIPVLDPLLITGEPLVAYPNPFNQELKLLFSLKEPAAVTLKVYSVNGEKVVSLHATFDEPGKTVITWNGRDAAGNRMKEGVYIVKLVINNKVYAVGRVLLEP